LNYLLVKHFKLSIEGSALAYYINGIIIFIIEIILVVIFKPFPGCFFCFNSESFTVQTMFEFLGNYVSILPILLCLNWNKEVLIFIAFAYLNANQLDALITSYNFQAIFNALAVGVAVSGLSTLGYYIGNKDFKKAFPILFYFTMFSLIVALLLTFFFFVFKDKLLLYFAKDLYEVTKHIEKSFLIICIFSIIEVINFNIVYWLRGLSAKFYTNVMSVIHFMIVQPIICFVLLKVYKYDDFGVWLACIISESLYLLINIVYLFWILDLEKACNEVYENNQKQIDSYKKEYHLLKEEEVEKDKVDKINLKTE